MITKPGNWNLKRLRGSVDWRLLLFLLLFLNIKLPVKILALVFIYLSRFNFNFGFTIKNSRLPLFYLFIIPIAFAGFIINREYGSFNYLLVFLTGTVFWLISILAVHQVKLSVEQTAPNIIHQTIIVFFMVNALVSVCNLAVIMHAAGSINPYTFKGLNQQYFISTGDYIKGITFDISSTNAVLCAMGVIYFLIKTNPLMLLVCLVTMLLTYSNLINLTLFVILLLVFIFKSSRDQKSLIIVCLGIFAVFMVKISPQNKEYINQRIDSAFHVTPNASSLTMAYPGLKTTALNRDSLRKKIATHYLDSVYTVLSNQHRLPKTPVVAAGLPLNNKDGLYIPGPDTNSAAYQISPMIEPDRQLLLDFIGQHKASMPMSSQPGYAVSKPGKLMAMLQTLVFLYHHPVGLVAGLGVGNFSSKLAFRASGLGLRGRYPENHIYINPYFLTNHLDLYINYFSKDVSLHSVSNNPFSVYDQMLAEYGVPGLLALIVFYLGFFAKQYRHLTYGFPILIFIAGIFFIDYWFEQLSVMVLFELMLFLNIREREINSAKKSIAL